eukprot:4003934-Pleurochrysis_carterae.AAC.2
MCAVARLNGSVARLTGDACSRARAGVGASACRYASARLHGSISHANVHDWTDMRNEASRLREVQLCFLASNADLWDQSGGRSGKILNRISMQLSSTPFHARLTAISVPSPCHLRVISVPSPCHLRASAQRGCVTTRTRRRLHPAVDARLRADHQEDAVAAGAELARAQR